MGFENTGIVKLVTISRKLPAIMDDELGKMAAKVGNDYYSEVRKNSPVDADGDQPGRLKQGWVYSGPKKLGRHGRQVVVSNGVDYAPYVEYGHRLVVHGKPAGFVRGRYFVKKSRNRIKKKLPDEYDAMIERVGRRLGL